MLNKPATCTFNSVLNNQQDRFTTNFGFKNCKGSGEKVSKSCTHKKENKKVSKKMCKKC